MPPLTLSQPSADLLLAALMMTALFLPVLHWLFPRLSPHARRVALVFFTLQLLILAMDILNHPMPDMQRWLWDIDQEWNIPSAFAAAQLAAIATLALFLARQNQPASRWRRIYLLGIGLVFLALLEGEAFYLYKSLVRSSIDWKLAYLLPGLPLLALTSLAAYRWSKRAWFWHRYVLLGLALLGIGAALIDDQSICGLTSILASGDCVKLRFAEEVLEMLGPWLALLSMLGIFSAEEPKPTRRHRSVLAAVPAAVFLAVLLSAPLFRPEWDEWRQLPLRLAARQELAAQAESAAVRFESSSQLHGYSLSHNDESLKLRLSFSSGNSETRSLGQSLHIVDQASALSLASIDTAWCCPHYLHVFAPDYSYGFEVMRSYPPWLFDEALYRQSLEVSLPPDTPRNRALWVVLSLWHEDGSAYVQQKILSSSHPLLSDTQVILGEIVLQAPASSGDPPPALARFDNGFALQPVTLPASASAGTSLPITFHWRADSASNEDYGQFLHMQHIESGEWVVYNQPPLGARLPTRLWYSGLEDSETWQLPLPAELAPGGYAISTGLYRVSDKERLPARDAQGAPWREHRVILGRLTLD